MPDRENEIISIVTFIHSRIGFRDPPFSLLDFCGAFKNYDLQPADMPRGFNGEILSKGKNKIIRYRAGSKPATNRFAIGHEIGHGFLHEDQEFQCKVSANFSIFKPPPGDSREWEADFFSAELLIPMPVLNRLVHDLDKLSDQEYDREVSRLADIFGVTTATMKTRFQDLKKMREWECEYL
ncbi:MAG: ImmA/IrrE family metallo-endopeptidase [bacterium]